MARMTTELETEFEDEAFLEALGGIAKTIGGMLGEGEEFVDDVHASAQDLRQARREQPGGDGERLVRRSRDP
jgi:hypothetical protein